MSLTIEYVNVQHMCKAQRNRHAYCKWKRVYTCMNKCKYQELGTVLNERRKGYQIPWFACVRSSHR